MELRSTATPSSRPAWLITAPCLLAALSWLMLRVFVGLDLTDEMQYYGEIASLTRTTKFFQDDLFVQQLGYVFVLPFFKLHAIVFPDQSYLLVFGRVLLLAFYVAIGALFWRSAGKLRCFSTTEKLIGLAGLAAWIPFQIFAISYNSLPYLLIVSTLALWMGQDRGRFLSYAIPVSVFLAALTVTYPPAGVVLIALAVADAIASTGLKAGAKLLGLTIGFCALIAAIIMGLHGLGFLKELIAALTFSRAFGVGTAFLNPAQLGRWLSLVVVTSCLIWRLHRGGPLSQRSHDRGWGSRRWFKLTMLLSGGIVLVVMSERCSTGYFASAGFVALLLFAAFTAHEANGRLIKLAIVGLTLGSVFSFTSGNGTHNFGIGAAGVLPFLMLCCARAPVDPVTKQSRGIARLAVAGGVAWLLLLNGVFHPYREARGWLQFKRVEGVPAFKGIWTSETKIEALAIFAHLCPPDRLQGKRVLVVGPYPSFYFVTKAQPSTPMFFMHSSGQPEAYELVAKRLFQNGAPDAILMAFPLPSVLHERVEQWIAGGCVSRRVNPPPEFIRRYRQLTSYDFPTEMLLLTRPSSVPL